MANNIEHRMTVDEVDFRLRMLRNIVNDDFIKAIDEARKYLDECRGMNDEK